MEDTGPGTRGPDTQGADTQGPGLPFRLAHSQNERTQKMQKFLDNIDGMSKVDQSSIISVKCASEFEDALKDPDSIDSNKMTPILWRGYTHHSSLSGLPSSIPDLLKGLRSRQIDTLDAHNYTAEKENDSQSLDDLKFTSTALLKLSSSQEIFCLYHPVVHTRSSPQSTRSLSEVPSTPFHFST
ncbi:hypothetical protein BJY04DRAFT_213220 [Aspergillus karnatakaensis]|uniref:uncharacterized protein n=1 Tax=Aspergillus karnatakaensis TaxID=1810916 RepID=UPI003CCC8F96